MNGISERRVCQLLGVSRSSMHAYKKRSLDQGPDAAPPVAARTPPTRVEANRALDGAIHALLQRFPTYGYRRIWAMLRNDGWKDSKKRVRGRMRANGWMVCQRVKTPRPRVQERQSIASEPNRRWSMDVVSFPCGEDGWGHLAVVMDNFNREVLGYEFALRGRAQEAVRALEEALLRRFGSLFVEVDGLVLRSDNGLIFQSKAFRAACHAQGVQQEFITPYMPQQNGVIERFFRSLKEECVWCHVFADVEEAKKAIEAWIRFYNHERPHSALGYKSPTQFFSPFPARVA